ncbi:hypothetical protein Tco_0637190 [Tanacetum coccineum]
MEVVVAATVAAAATAVLHGDCDGGDFGEVERRRGGGVRMMMAAVVRDGDGWHGGGDSPESGRNLVGTRERRRKILERENCKTNGDDVVDGASVIGDDLDGGRCGGGLPDVVGDSPKVGEAAGKFGEKIAHPETWMKYISRMGRLEEKCLLITFRIESLRFELYLPQSGM